MFRATPISYIVPLGGDLGYLYQGQFHQKPFVFAGAIVQVAIIAQLHGSVEERQRAFLRLRLVALADACAYFEQGQGTRVFAYQQVAEVRGQAGDEMAAIESFVQHIVQQQQGIAYFIFKEVVGQFKVILVIQYVQVLDYALVGDVSAGEAHYLVKYGQSVRIPPSAFRAMTFSASGSAVMPSLEAT